MFSAPRPGTSRLRFVIATTLVLLIAATSVPAIDENLTKGATNNHVFASGVWGENIDVLNGGLNLTIPIGPTYRVAGDVSYQLKVTYSSKIWQVEGGSSGDSGSKHHRARSRLQGRGQAGLGFMLQMGRFMKHENSAECKWDNTGRLWEEVFEDSTGAAHPAWGARGTPDGSHLWVNSSTSPWQVKMPDGTRYVLGQSVPDLLTSADPNWPRCSPTYDPNGTYPPANQDIYTNDYRGTYVTRIEGRDRNAGVAYNYASIDYDPNAGMKHLMKKITNYRNGVADNAHVITFENTNVDPNYPNDLNKNLPMGYVKSVTVPTFSTDPGTPETATYTFNYIVADVWDPYVDPNDPNSEYRAQDNLDDKFERTLLLTGITFPEGFTMSFGYTGPGWGGRNVGYVQSRVLPTGAKIEYDFHQYAIAPETCGPVGSIFVCYPRFAGWTQGVGIKRVIPDPNAPSVNYPWTYTRYSEGKPNPEKVVVTDPFGNDTVTYFHADMQDTFYDPPGGPAGDEIYHNLIWRNGKSYKTEYYRGSSGNPGNVVRREEQVWEDELQHPDEPYFVHLGTYPRMTESRVTYVDDGGKSSLTKYDEYDGFGNFRKVTEYGFDGQPFRIHRQDYNCDNRDPNGWCLVVKGWADMNCTPGPGYNCPLSQAHLDNWVLGTYSFTQNEDPDGNVLQRSEYLFDPNDGVSSNDVGYLRVRKDLLTLPAPADRFKPSDPNDHPGDIKTVFNYEGDTTCPVSGTYRTGNVCSKVVSNSGLTSTTFQENYTYAHGAYLKTRGIAALDPNWFAEDRDVDEGTGLTRVSRDPNGIATSFDYDSLGRLTLVVPGSSTLTEGTEKKAVLTYPDIWTTRLEQQVSSSDKIYSQFSFDTLGRLVKIEKRQADTAGTLVGQKTSYDIAGRVTWQSEWGDPNVAVNDPNKGTSFDYTDPLSDPSDPVSDPFGRVRTTLTADGQVTFTDYAGMSSTTTIHNIKGPAGWLDATTHYEKDAFGRLTSVLTPRTYPSSGGGVFRTGADAYYTYDRLDRLVGVRLESQVDPNIATSALVSQYRSFTYDALGRQTMATNPENGTVNNLSYDAAGNLLSRSDAGGNTFTYEYDAASRLKVSKIQKPGGTPKTVLENTYDQTTGSFGPGLGKLTTTISYDDANTFVSKEEKHYGGTYGLNGRLAEQSFRFGGWNPAVTDPNLQPELKMSYEYNVLGLVSRVTYPEKPGLGRTVLSPQYSYLNGMMTRNGTNAAVRDTNRGDLVDTIEYNPAGGVSLIRTRGSVATTITPDVRNRPLTLKIERTSPTPLVTHLTAQTYSYDGAGNITQIASTEGNDQFAYDDLNRLVSAHLNNGTKLEDLTWKYDQLGNMTRQWHQTTSGSVVTSATNWFTMSDPNHPNKNQIVQYGVDRIGGPASDPNVPMEYDVNGNVVTDRNYNLVYDARNRLLEVRNKSTNDLVARYTYDAGGYRTSKYDPVTGATVYFVRDASGQTLSEFTRPNRAGALPAWQKDYVYAVGRHVAMVENDVPAVPTGVGVSASMPDEFWTVYVSWTPNPDTDIAGYYVERVGGSPISQYVGAQTYYYDASVTEGVAYSYRISAVDLAGNQSSFTDYSVITPADTTPPNAPTASSATGGDNRVDLAWQGPSDADLAYYRVYRRVAPSGAWAQVGGPIPKTVSTLKTFADTGVTNGTAYDYQVKAVDTADLESAGSPATPWQVTPHDNAPPDVPQGVYGIGEATSVKVFWRASVAADTSKYKLYRKSAPFATEPWVLVTPTGTTAVTYEDTGRSSNTEYRYSVTAVDGVTPTPNESSKSQEIAVFTKDSAVPAPNVTLAWAYCLYIDYLTGDCYLPANLTSSLFTHENFRQSTFSWGPGGSGATLKKFRIYHRRSTADPYQLIRELPVPPSTNPNASYDSYPLGIRDNFGPTPALYEMKDHGFDPDEACYAGYYRVSAIAEVGEVDRESVLSPEMTTPMPASLRVPENLQVVVESIDSGVCTLCPATCTRAFTSQCSPNRMNAQYYGLTLGWEPGTSSCGNTIAGYHVYRSHLDSTFPIKLTREPVSASTYRVEYLPLKGTNSFSSVPPTAFIGATGYTDAGCCGDDVPKMYAVKSVDVYGNVSEFSRAVKAHTDSTDRTKACLPTPAPCPPTTAPFNYEAHPQLKLLEPTPSTVDPPNDPNGVTWEWRYGRDSLADVGEAAGNWALVKWGLPVVDPNHDPANDFRLLRQVAGDPNYYEVVVDGKYLDVIPGDDRGIRQFIWDMPLKLACEDANYMVKAVDMYGRSATAGPSASNVVFKAKQALAPENPYATTFNNVITVSWDAFPTCTSGHAPTTFELMQSNAAATNCDPNAMPPDPNFVSVKTVNAPTTSLTYTPTISTTERRWYKLKATWGSSGASLLSAAMCTSASGLTSENWQDPMVPREEQFGEHRTRLAQAATPPNDPPGVEPEDIEKPEMGDLVASPHRTIGLGADPPVKLYFYHVDHLGTPRVITDVLGNLVSKHKYLPFGGELSPPPSTNSHKFTGHERDTETGLDYMKARYYGTSLARFTTTDPLTFNRDRILNPQRLNLYTYADNNPVEFIDPTGRDVAVGARDVDWIPGGDRHTFIVITPSGGNVQKYANRIGADGKITLSGFEGNGNRLVGMQNDSRDMGRATNTLAVAPPAGASTEKFETDVIEAFDSYPGNLEYDGWPKFSNGYNSNSLASGILNAAGAAATKPTEEQIGGAGAPGWRQPVPLPSTTANGNPGPKVHKQTGTERVCSVAAGYEASGMNTSLDGGSSNSHMKQGFKGDLTYNSVGIR